MSNILNRLEAALASHYRIERELGRGGMATVYLARDLRHDRPVALKLLHLELAATLGPERFLKLGEILYLSGQYDESIAQSQRALELQPNFPWALTTLGLSYAAQGRYPQDSVAPASRA